MSFETNKSDPYMFNCSYSMSVNSEHDSQEKLSQIELTATMQEHETLSPNNKFSPMVRKVAMHDNIRVPAKERRMAGHALMQSDLIKPLKAPHSSFYSPDGAEE